MHEEGGGGPATQNPRSVTTILSANFTIKPRGKCLSPQRGSHTILFTVETQEELCRGFYPSIGGALC